MKIILKKLFLSGLVIVSALSVLATGCSTSTATSTKPATTTAAATTAVQGPTVLTLTSGTQSKTFSMAQIKGMTPLSGFAGQKNKQGVITGPVAYKGVALLDLLAGVGGLPTGAGLKVTASDGFSKSFTNAQLNGTFTLYDKTGAEAAADVKPVVFVVYEREGAEIDAANGPIQVGIMTGQNRVCDNSLWVKLAVAIEVVPAQ